MGMHRPVVLNDGDAFVTLLTRRWKTLPVNAFTASLKRAPYWIAGCAPPALARKTPWTHRRGRRWLSFDGDFVQGDGDHPPRLRLRGGDRHLDISQSSTRIWKPPSTN